MTFEYSPEELGLDEKISPKFLDIRRLRPIDHSQPWGIFFIAFDETKLSVVALRRLLSVLSLKKRSTRNTGEIASWHSDDLLFISQTGSNDERNISFAHFASNPDKKGLQPLKILGWDTDDTGLKIDHIVKTLREKLVWPENPSESQIWREQWRSAFTIEYKAVIRSSKELSEKLGALALNIRTRIQEILKLEKDTGPLSLLMKEFKKNLIANLNIQEFSDMYAQTISYGLLSDRIVNPKKNKSDAIYKEIPLTNPLLHDLMEKFMDVTVVNKKNLDLDFDELGINDVKELLDNTDIDHVLRDFMDRNQHEDPVMYLFEEFMDEYDKEQRRKQGVWYTPQPVVSFIVRSADDELRQKFGLEDGLADNISWADLIKKNPNIKVPSSISPKQPFVQILDVATGTGTFIVEVIDQIHKTMKNKWLEQGINQSQIMELWNKYVPEKLLPRLYGFENMMASYTIAHIKVALKLHETGYKFNGNERIQIYLTNSLEPAINNKGIFSFAVPAMAKEGELVSDIKKDKQFTVFIGNPPYKGDGGTSGGWIGELMEDYKKEPGGKEKLNERNPKYLNDPYVKFIRMCSAQIKESNAGVLALITNNGYLDNKTFRGMRWHLLDTFDYVSILDLHGSIKKKEITPEGVPDQNVFDILSGVGIIIGTKNNYSNKFLAKLSHGDLWGSKKELKFEVMNKNIISKMVKNLKVISPDYHFVRRNLELAEKYEKGFSVNDFFINGQCGFTTHRDRFSVAMNKSDLINRLNRLKDKQSTEELMGVFKFDKKSKDWSLEKAHKRLLFDFEVDEEIARCLYRPFDRRYYFTSRDLNDRPRPELANHIKNKDNISLCISKLLSSKTFQHALVSDVCAESCYVSSNTKEGNYNFPLYTYPKKNELIQHRDVNFKKELWDEILIKSDHPSFGKPCELEIFDYIYGVLYSPKYRKTYNEPLKYDFARIPWPANPEEFYHISEKGSLLRKLHLMDTKVIGKKDYPLKGNGSYIVAKPFFKDDKVYINDNQYFGNVSNELWKFYIGGYQPAEKWLKDRKDFKLTQEEIKAYQLILNILRETKKIMSSIKITI